VLCAVRHGIWAVPGLSCRAGDLFQFEGRCGSVFAIGRVVRDCRVVVVVMMIVVGWGRCVEGRKSEGGSEEVCARAWREDFFGQVVGFSVAIEEGLLYQLFYAGMLMRCIKGSLRSAQR
jgi:hypothetical protein